MGFLTLFLGGLFSCRDFYELCYFRDFREPYASSDLRESRTGEPSVLPGVGYMLSLLLLPLRPLFA